MGSSYSRARKGKPCPVCTEEASRCQIFEDGKVNCRNIQDADSPLLGDLWKWVGNVRGGPGGSTVIPVPPEMQLKAKGGARAIGRTAKKAAAKPATEGPKTLLEGGLQGSELEAARAYEAKRDEHFKALLAATDPLDDKQVEDLVDRGIPRERVGELHDLGFRKLENGQAYGSAAGCVGLDDRGVYKGPSGFLIPSFRTTPDGRQYLGFQVATCQDGEHAYNGGKYIFLSQGADKELARSENYLAVINEDGTKDGAPLFSYIPNTKERIQKCYLTDGALKAYLTGMRHGVAAVGSPGFSYTSQMGQLRSVLMKLVGQNAELKIALAPDAGDPGNEHMVPMLHQTAQMVQSWGYSVTWLQLHQELGKDGGKDIDEVDSEAEAELTTSEFLKKSLASIRRTAEKRATRQQWEFGFRTLQETDELELPFCHTDPVLYKAGERTKTLVDILARGQRLIVDRSGTGAGKSYWWASLGRPELEALGVDQVLVLSPRNMEQGEEFGAPYLRGRQPNGAKMTADGRILTVQGKHGINKEKGEKIFRNGNCTQGKALQKFQQRNMGASLASLCTNCGDREMCEMANGGYRHDREEVLANPVVVMHPAAMQEQFLIHSKDGEGGAARMPRTGVVLDDVGLALLTETVVIDADSVRRTVALMQGNKAFVTISDLLTTGRTVSSRELHKAVHGALQASVGSATTETWGNIISQEEGAAGGSRDSDPWVCWLDYLRDWVDGRAVAQILPGGTISFKRYNKRLVAGLRNAAWVLVLDATASVRVMEAVFGTTPDVIAEERYLTPADLQVTQIMGLGGLGYNRPSQQEFQLKVLLKVLAKTGWIVKDQTAVVDTKEGLKFSEQFGKVGLTFMGDSRGSNRAYQAGCTHLLMIGSPNTNLLDSASTYELLFHQSVDVSSRRNVTYEVAQEAGDVRMVCSGVGSEDRDFGRFYNMLRQVEQLQALGRLRHQRREGEVLHVTVLGDSVLPFPVRLMTMAEATKDAEHPEGRVTTTDLALCSDSRLRSAAFQLKVKGLPRTPATIAEEVGLRPRLVAEWFGHQEERPRWLDQAKSAGPNVAPGGKKPKPRRFDDNGRKAPTPLRSRALRVVADKGRKAA